MEGRNDPPEYRVSGIARQYIHASFLRRNPQHAECGHGRRYAGAVTISFTQSDASDVTSASASLRRVRRLGSVLRLGRTLHSSADRLTNDRAYAVRHFAELSHFRKNVSP
jgi:hypothetical protein